MDSTTTRFRFRDQGMDDSTESDISEDDSSSPEPGDDESELKSMTGKVISYQETQSVRVLSCEASFNLIFFRRLIHG